MTHPPTGCCHWRFHGDGSVASWRGGAASHSSRSHISANRRRCEHLRNGIHRKSKECLHRSFDTATGSSTSPTATASALASACDRPPRGGASTPAHWQHVHVSEAMSEMEMLLMSTFSGASMQCHAARDVNSGKAHSHCAMPTRAAHTATAGHDGGSCSLARRAPGPHHRDAQAAMVHAVRPMVCANTHMSWGSPRRERGIAFSAAGWYRACACAAPCRSV